MADTAIKDLDLHIMRAKISSVNGQWDKRGVTAIGSKGFD
jgi:hypothetical protein